MPKARTKRSPKQDREHGEKACRELNERHPVGSTVWYWTSLPFGPVKETTVRRDPVRAARTSHPIPYGWESNRRNNKPPKKSLLGGVAGFKLFRVNHSVHRAQRRSCRHSLNELPRSTCIQSLQIRESLAASSNSPMSCKSAIHRSQRRSIRSMQTLVWCVI